MDYLNRFVTAKLKGVDESRQGVVIEQTGEKLILLGESGEQRECEPPVTIVPLSLMWGDTRMFAIKNGVIK